MTTALDLERDLLAALLAEGSVYADTAGLTPADFCEDDHGELFRILGQIPAAPGPVPLTLIVADIANKGKRHRFEALVTELWHREVSAVFVPQMSQAIKTEARTRRIAEAAQTLAKCPGNQVVQAQLAALLADVPAPSLSRSLFLSAGDFLQDEVHFDYLVSRLIERDTTGQLFGPSGGGKTFIALHMALAVATGGELHGHRAERGLVLYLAGEGRGGLRRRVKAFQKHHGAGLNLLHLLNLFHVSRQTIPFDGSGLPAVKAEAKSLSDRSGLPVALIVVDTLARHLDGDENSTSDMNRFVAAVDDLRSTFPGAVALIVHHSGHGEDTKKRARGSSALKAAMDFEICCDRGLLTFTKMKDSEEPEPIPFKLRPVQIGTDQDGTPLTSCVVEFGERSERDKQESLTSMEQLAVRALLATSARIGTVEEGKPAAYIGDWRDDFYTLRREEDPDQRTDTLKKSFTRAAEGLAKKSIIAEKGHVRILLVETTGGHGTKRDIGANVPGEVQGDTGHTLYIGCPDVPLPVPPGAEHEYIQDPEEELALWN